MKTRRLLALVLCFVMLFSDATSTLASTNSGEPIVITDSSELEELLNIEVMETEAVDTEVETTEVPETDVTSTEETSEEAVSTETTEVVVPEGTEETVEEPETSTEVLEPTEVVEGTEEIKAAAATSLTVGYSDENMNWVNIGETYTSFSDAVTAIEALIAANPGFNRTVTIFMQADGELTSDLELSTLDVQLGLALNGHTLTIAQDMAIRADVTTSNDMTAGIVDVGAGVTLSILPFDPCGQGNSFDEAWESGEEYTNWQNVVINFDSANPGNLIVGQQYDNGTLTNAHVRLNDVLINNAKNVTFEGSVGYDGSIIDRNTILLDVAETFTISNANDDENGIWQNAELLTKISCTDMVWNGHGTVNDLTVANKFTTSGRSGIKVWSALDVKDIEATPGQETYDTFDIRNAYLYDANGNFLSKASIEITGTITKASDMEYAINFTKVHEELQSDGGRWEMGHLPYGVGEVLAVAPNAEAALTRVNSGSGAVMLVVKNTNGELVTEKAAVQIWVHDDENGYTVKEMFYASWDAAIAGLATDFAGVEGRYNLMIYEDITLTQDAVIPDNIGHICVNAPRFGEGIFDDNGAWIGDHEWIVCPVVDLNGHSIIANGDMEWAEVIQIKNSSAEESEIYIKAEANPGPDGYWPSFRVNWFDEGIELVDTAGNPFSFGNEYIFIDNVNIRVPNGRAEFNTAVGGTHIINGALIVSAFKGHQGKWQLSDVTIVGSTDGSFIHESAEVTITGKATWLGGAGVEVRGTLTFGDIFMNANEEDPYANMWVEIVEVFDRDAEGTDDYFIAKGNLTFAGAIETAEEFKGSNAVHIGKKAIFYYQATDENGNPLFHDPEGNDPMIWEDQRWELPFEKGETVAYVKNNTVSANMFGTYDNEVLFAIENQELKVNKASVLVDTYIEEEDRGIGFRYQSLEEAFANLEKDFEGREGHYTVSILSDVTLEEDIVVPNVVKSLRLQSRWEWIEHFENDEPIYIFDEEGNVIGVEGHDDVYMTTLDMNGHSITSDGTFELMEGLSIVSTGEKGVIVSNAVTGGDLEIWAAISIMQADGVNLMHANGESIDRNSAYQWTFLDNVDVVADNGLVNLHSRWANYTVNGNIHANEVYVRGNWTAKDVTALNDGCIDSGWYDEATDQGEPDGYLTVDNFTIEAGDLYQGGRLIVKDTFTATMALVRNHGDLIAEKIVMPSGTYVNYGRTEVKDAAIERLRNDMLQWYDDETGEFEWEAGGLFICDTYTQNGSGYTWLIGCSSFVVNERAEIYNLRVGDEYWGGEYYTNFCRMPDATINILGTVEHRQGENFLCCGIFDLPANAVGFGLVKVVDTDEEGNVMGTWFKEALVDVNGNEVTDFNESDWPMQTLQRDEVLFTIENEFPVECIRINQPDGNEDETRYWSAYQMDDKVLVGGNWIHVLSSIVSYGPYGEEIHQDEFLKEFSVWSDAIEYIDKLANSNIGYIIVLTDDINTYGPLALPVNAKNINISGAREEQVTLTYEGDITVAADLQFENIKLNAVNSDGTPYYSAVKVDDAKVTFNHSTAEFASITGTKASKLNLYWGSSLKLTGDLTGIEKLELHSTTLEAGGKLTLKDVVSLDNKNKIIVKDGDSLTITGTITGPSIYDEFCKDYAGESKVADDFSFNVTEEHPAIAKVRASAIDITVKSLEGKYKEGDALVNAPNVPAAWFVVGSGYDAETGERTSIKSLTYKEDDIIYYGQSDVNNKVELQVHEDGVEGFITYDTYATLADAFAAIDRIGNTEAIYSIILHDNVDIATLTTPSKARSVQIWVENEAPWTITYGGDIKLNCHFLIANAILAPQSDKSKIELGNFSMELISGTKLANGCKITSITGSGVAKDSTFSVHDAELTISGDIKNVGSLWIQSAVVNVEGSVNVGDIVGWIDTDIPEAERLQPTLIGTAKVTRKDGKVTKVEPQITFAGEMWYHMSEVYVALQEKQADGTYKLLDFTAAEMTDVLAAGIPLVKAPKISSMMIFASQKNKAVADQYVTTKANGYVTVRKNVADVGLVLGYLENDIEVYTGCATIADAVTEINNLNTVRDYQMSLLPQMTSISSKAPAELKMPNAKAIASLIIMSDSTTVDLYYTGKINFTSNVALINVNFVQTAKDGTPYAANDTPSAVAISAGGKEMVLANVAFNTPIKLEGKKGKLYIFGPVITLTNQASDRANGSVLGDVTGDGYPELSRVCGSITNFAEIGIASDFVLDEYKSGSSYTAPVLSVTALNIVNSSVFELYSYDMKAKATVTDLVAANSELYVEGSATIKNSVLSGESWVGALGKLAVTDVTLYDSPMMLGVDEFVISGTITSDTSDAVLASFRKSADNLTPGLNIKGKVTLTAPENKIGILVYEYNGSGIPTLTGAPSASGMLLSAKNATPDMFKAGALPYDENTTLDNVGGKGAYAANNMNGYVLAKSGSNIYVYYGNEINVELSDGNGNVLGYYSNIADATKAIDALKDKDASYMLTLMNTYGSADAPVELKLPKQASTLAIMKNNGKMYINGKVALNASTALVVASEAEFAGDVTGKGTFAIGRNMTVTVKGKFDANNLALNGGSVLDAKNAVTIGTIANNGAGQNQNKIIYGKDAKNVTYLTIKGWVDGNNTNPVLLQMISDTAKASYELDSEKYQVILDNTQKIATIEKAPLSSFEVMINEETFYAPEGEPKFTYQLVKANKGVYHVAIDTDADWNGTWLEFTKDGKTYVTCCLDFTQAINEINVLADKNTDYIINICRKNTTISDVNLTDTKPVSPITMPKANMANSVTIAYSGFNNWQEGIEFTGNISYAGNLGFVNCTIEAAKISKVKTLTLDNTAFVTTDAVSVDNVVIKGNTTWDAFGKTTVGGLDATEQGANSYLASKADAKGVPTFTVNGDVPAVTVWKVLKANATADTAVNNRYISTYKDVSLVVAKAAGADRFIAYPFADADVSNNEGITNVVAYKDAKNAVKNGNGDDMKVLLSYEGGSTYTKSYDEAVTLIDSIGDKEGFYEIQFLTGGEVTTTGVAGSYGKLTVPKKAFYVEISGHFNENGKPDTTLKYTGTMKTSVNLIFRDIELTEGTANGSVFTPSYAVTPVTSGKTTEINFVGEVSTLKKDNTQKADLAFTSVGGNGIIVIRDRDVEVADSVSANIFVMNNGGTVSVGKDVKVTELVIADNATIEANGKFTSKIVRVLDIVKDEYLCAKIDADGAIALTDIYGDAHSDGLRIVTNRTAANESQLTINGEISGTAIDVAMNVLDSSTGKYREMTIADAKALLVTEENAVPAKTQKIVTAPKASTNVGVLVYEQVDEAGNKDWVYFGELPNENPEEEPQWITTYKHDGGMYITNLPTLVGVYGGTEDSEYYAEFMNWEQAVKEVDKRNDKEAYYHLNLYRNVGQDLDGTLSPLKNLTLPSKAKQVIVFGGCNNIFFTGNKIAPKTNMVFAEIGLMAVKEVKEGTESWYESTSYDVNIGNNYVVMDNIQRWTEIYNEYGDMIGHFDNMPGTISGSKKGMFEFHRSNDGNNNEIAATMIKGVGTVMFWDEFFNEEIDHENMNGYTFIAVPKGITGVENLILNPYVNLESLEGDISVNNVLAKSSNIVSKNITVKKTAELEEAWLVAGTEVVGDGAVKLGDVVLDNHSGISAKQDKKGNSLIQISGTVTAGAEYEGETEGMLQIELWYNDRSRMAQLYNKMILVTAPKADASWFAPLYSWRRSEQAVDEETGEPLWDEETGEPILVPLRNPETGELLRDEEGNLVYYIDYSAMGWPMNGYGVYKLGKAIYYGKLAE